MRTLVVFILAAIELNSYCKGVCHSRYQDGFFSSGRCACIDFIPVNLKQRFEIPKRPKKEFDEPKVYDGSDRMHYAPADSEIPLTAPMDF